VYPLPDCLVDNDVRCNQKRHWLRRQCRDGAVVRQNWKKRDLPAQSFCVCGDTCVKPSRPYQSHHEVPVLLRLTRRFDQQTPNLGHRRGLLGQVCLTAPQLKPPFKCHFESGLNSHQLRAASLFLTSRCRIAVVVVSLPCVSYRSFLCFSFVVCQDHKLTCRWKAGLGEEDNSHCLLLALLLSCGKGLKPTVGICRC